MKTKQEIIQDFYDQLDHETKEFLEMSIERIIDVKRRNGKIVVVTGSGPNLHEGVTTLIAELINKDIIDGVTTSSAVIAHEMGGVLDKVKRVDAAAMKGYIDFLTDGKRLPRGDVFEFTMMTEEETGNLKKEMLLDERLMDLAPDLEGKVIIKAAGNMAYPMGLRTEELAVEVESLAKTYGLPFEYIAGLGADHRTMIGAGARKGVPVLVSIPQLVGGGTVGSCIADSIPVKQRCARIARMMEEADLIIESAVVLTQEIHDGPYETYTGHGIWASWLGYRTYSLEGKTVVRIDLDENLRKAWKLDKTGGTIQSAIDEGLPKTKLTSIPFRMEMSSFSRLENSIPLVGDIGIIWPVIAQRVSKALDRPLDFMSYPQHTPEGGQMREFIVNEIKPVDRARMIREIKAKDFFNNNIV
jgi:hypothetical protein